MKLINIFLGLFLITSFAFSQEVRVDIINATKSPSLLGKDAPKILFSKTLNGKVDSKKNLKLIYFMTDPTSE